MPDNKSSRSPEEEVVRLIQRGHNDRLTHLLNHLGRAAVRCTTQDDVRQPLLHLAIQHRNDFAARLLLDKGADPCLKDAKGRTALHAAAQVDNTSMIVTLLKSCPVNTQDEEGNTALHVAVSKTSVQTVKWLIFGGADPDLKNKKGVPCRQLTRSNLVLQVLRDFSNARPPLCFALLVPSTPYMSQSLRCSITLSSSSSSSAGIDFVFYSSSYHNLSSSNLSHLHEEDEVCGSVVEYRLTKEVEATLTFPLEMTLEPEYEMVLRVLASDTGCHRDVCLDVKETDPDDPSPPESGPADPGIIYLAHGQVTTRLDDAGLLFLLHRPLQQSVRLRGGLASVCSVVDKRVELSSSDTFQGCFTGELQLERAAPLKEEAALAQAPPTKDLDLQSQTDYVKLRAEGPGFASRQPQSPPQTQAGPVTLPSASARGEPQSPALNITLPRPPDYSGGPLTVYIRMDSRDSVLTTSSRRESSSSVIEVDIVASGNRAARAPSEADTSATESEAEDEREARRWTRTQTVSLPKDSKSMKLPMVINKTMTVVETKGSVPEERVKRSIARQYKKRKYKPAIFFVAARPWEGWRECKEVLVVVTSPTLLSMEVDRHLKNEYSIQHVSKEFRVPSRTDFKLCVIGDLLVEYGDSEAVITFHHVMHEQQTGNQATFVLRKKSEKSTKGRFKVDQKRKKQKKGQSLWKLKGELHFDLSYVSQSLRQNPGPEEQELKQHFSDRLLLDLADRLPVAEAAALGIRLGLTHTQVQNVLHSPLITSPVFKCFELLRAQRDRSEDAVQYCRSLMPALRDMDWNLQCDWLVTRLRDWPQLGTAMEN